MQTQKVEPISIDLDNLSAYEVGNEMQLDTQPEATDVAWDFALPPVAGLYDLKIYPSSLGAVQDPATKDIRMNLECRIASDDKDSDNQPVFEMVSTKLGRGKNINTMAALLIRMGVEVPASVTPMGLFTLFLNSLKKEPIVRGNYLEWRGYSKENKRNIYTTFESWPMLGKDLKTKKLKVMVPYRVKGDRQVYMEEIQPNLYVVKWGWANAQKAKEASAGLGKAIVAHQPIVVASAIVDESQHELGFSEEDLAAAMEG